jgi:hypothetical protein
MFPDEVRVLQIERTRVRLLFRDADFGQVVDQDLGLDLEFTRQLINADLIWICHSPLSLRTLIVLFHQVRKLLFRIPFFFRAFFSCRTRICLFVLGCFARLGIRQFHGLGSNAGRLNFVQVSRLG